MLNQLNSFEVSLRRSLDFILAVERTPDCGFEENTSFYGHVV
jgi:hypothetical protein